MTTATPLKLRKEVHWFAQEMERKLRKNDHKRHWSHCEAQHLSMRLTQEREELRRAVACGDPDEILSEAADVGNFAMMIADVARRSK